MPNTEVKEPIVIRSEDDAWRLLEDAVNGRLPDDVQIRFNGWPVWSLDAKGRDWHSTVPTRVMPPLLDVQRDINRAYVQLRYGAFNLRRLREDEKNDLEIVVGVGPGSSLFDAELWKQFSKMAEVATQKMNGPQVVCTVLGIALMITSAVMYKNWLATRAAEKDAETQVALSEQETQRLQVMAQAITRTPTLVVVRDDTAATTNRMLKTARPGDVVTLKGVPVTSAQAAELVQPERERSSEVELSGSFIILGNRTDKGAGFRITLKRISDSLEVTADVKAELPRNQREILKQAEWSKRPVELTIDADLLRDTFARAVVTSVKTADEEKPD